MARRTTDPKLLPDPEDATPKKRKRILQRQDGETKELVAELVESQARDPRLCDAPAVIRYPRPPNEQAAQYPEAMWGLPILDDNGERQYRECGNYAIRGSHVCQAHGGSVPLLKKSAEELLAHCRDKMMAGLLRIAFDETMDPRLRFDALKWGLERSGFQAGVTVNLGMKPWQEALAALKEQMSGEA